MSQFYDNMAATALALLAKFGGPVSIFRQSSGSVHPVTGLKVAGVDETYTATGMITKYKDQMIDGVRILSGDRKLVLSNEHEPLPSDKPVIDGERWSIVNIDKVAPDQTTKVVYFVQVRR